MRAFFPSPRRRFATESLIITYRLPYVQVHSARKNGVMVKRLRDTRTRPQLSSALLLSREGGEYYVLCSDDQSLIPPPARQSLV